MNNKKIVIAVSVFAIVLMIPIIFSSFFYVYHGGWTALYWEMFQGGDINRLETKYDEDWMIGKTKGEIIDEYGEFDINGDDEGIYYILYKNRPDSYKVKLLVKFSYDESAATQICIGTEKWQHFPPGG